MTSHLCTLFDQNYLAKGIALQRSCARWLPDFHLWVFALDDAAWDWFARAAPKNVTVIARNEFEDAALLVVKPTRTNTEYIWTMTPYPMLYLLEKRGLDAVTYMDADCYLFGDLAPFYAELKDADIGIVPHRFTPRVAKHIANGVYNVSGVYFRKGDIALKCLREWRDQCLMWCYQRCEDGKFGDQAYLNEWPAKYGARVVQNVGVNLAPWNQEQYEYTFDKRLYIIQRGGNVVNGVTNVEQITPVIFYHFHEFFYNPNGVVKRCNYPVHPTVAEYIYQPYEAEMAQIRRELN